VTAPRVVVAGGHSAGHIEPTMNFANALRRLEPTAEITALTPPPSGSRCGRRSPGPTDPRCATQPGSGSACDPTGRY